MARAKGCETPEYRTGYKSGYSAGYRKAKSELENSTEMSVKAKAHWVLKDREWYCSKCKTKCEQKHYDFCSKCGSPMSTEDEED